MKAARRVRPQCDDVGRVSAARALGVIGVDRAARNRANRLFEKAHLVERIGVNRHLDVGRIRYREGGIDRARRRAPVFVQFQTEAARVDLFVERCESGRIAFAEKADVDRSSSVASSIWSRCHAPGVHVVAFVPDAGPVPPPIIVVTPLRWPPSLAAAR